MEEKSSLGVKANLVACVNYLLYIFPFAGVITSVLLMLFEKESRFVKFHAVQSLLLTLIGGAVVFVLAITIVGMILALPLLIAGIILWVIAMVKALQGESWKIPVIGKIAEQASSAL